MVYVTFRNLYQLGGCGKGRLDGAADETLTADMWKELTRETWRARLRGVQRNVEVWQALLSVRSLVLPPSEDVHTYLKFASLCRKSGRTRCRTLP